MILFYLIVSTIIFLYLLFTKIIDFRLIKVKYNIFLMQIIIGLFLSLIWPLLLILTLYYLLMSSR
jgi:hypothetical protein